MRDVNITMRWNELNALTTFLETEKINMEMELKELGEIAADETKEELRMFAKKKIDWIQKDCKKIDLALFLFNIALGFSNVSIDLCLLGHSLGYITVIENGCLVRVEKEKQTLVTEKF